RHPMLLLPPPRDHRNQSLNRSKRSPPQHTHQAHVRVVGNIIARRRRPIKDRNQQIRSRRRPHSFDKLVNQFFRTHHAPLAPRTSALPAAARTAAASTPATKTTKATPAKSASSTKSTSTKPATAAIPSAARSEQHPKQESQAAPAAAPTTTATEDRPQDWNHYKKENEQQNHDRADPDIRRGVFPDRRRQ